MKAVGTVARKVHTETQSFDEAIHPTNNQANSTNQQQSRTNFMSNPAKFKSYTYSTQYIHRMQIFYCSAMNRAPGLFASSTSKITQIFSSTKVKKSHNTSTNSIFKHKNVSTNTSTVKCQYHKRERKNWNQWLAFFSKM